MHLPTRLKPVRQLRIYTVLQTLQNTANNQRGSEKFVQALGKITKETAYCAPETHVIILYRITEIVKKYIPCSSRRKFRQLPTWQRTIYLVIKDYVTDFDYLL